MCRTNFLNILNKMFYVKVKKSIIIYIMAKGRVHTMPVIITVLL